MQVVVGSNPHGGELVVGAGWSGSGWGGAGVVWSVGELKFF